MAFPVAEIHIAAEEQKLGRVLPVELRARLLRQNGGEVRTSDDIWQIFPVFDPSDRKRIARTANHIERETASLRKWTDFPAGTVALAANGSGDALILCAGSGTSRRWHHETGKATLVVVEWSE